MVIGEAERLLGLTLIIFGIFLIIAGTLIYFLPHIKEFKLTENPLGNVTVMFIFD